MRFLLLAAMTQVLGCPAPVNEDPPEDAGIVIPDAGCPSRCPAGETLCDCDCVRLTSDEGNCGECGNACEPAPAAVGWTCIDSACSCNTVGEPSLCDGTPTSTCCNDRKGVGCFDLTTSLDHCGTCSTTCDRYGDGVSDHCESSACVCGDLGEACRGELDSTCCIDEGGANARCANLLQDEVDCGGCGLACPTDPLAPNGDRCRNGQCVCGPGTPEVPAEACPEGQVCCGTGDTAACAAAGSCG